MKLVIQRVKSAKVTLTETGIVCGAINQGLMVLVGVGDTDGAEDAPTEATLDWAEKVIMTTKFWPSEDGKPWKHSLESSGFSVLLVSQFTLYAKVYKKGKLDFHHALGPDPAKSIYDLLVARIQARTCVTSAGAGVGVGTEAEVACQRCQTGCFGAMMDVELVNDGPVTLMLDSNAPEG